jgi:hypothetical protein
MKKTMACILLVLEFVMIVSGTKIVYGQTENENPEDCYTGMICFDWEHAVWHPVGDGGFWTDPQNFGQVVNDHDLCVFSHSDWCMINYPGYSHVGGTGGNTAFPAVNIPIPLEVIPPPCKNPPCLAPTPQPTPMPPTGKCPGPQVIPGKISAFASKDSPPYAIVVGQDPAKRGVDLTYSFSIQPTLYNIWAWEIVDESTRCEYDPAGGYSGCPLGKYANGWRSWWESSPYTYVNHQVVWGCVKHTTAYREGVQAIIPSANLSKGSISWITNDLAQRYPGAFLHHPKWSWGYAGPGFGSFSGSTFVWNFSIKKVQVSDPGIYDLTVSGLTTGTPVSQPRSFSIRAGSMDVYLLETTIIH